MSMTNSEFFKIEWKEKILLLSFNRPKQLNALNEELLKEAKSIFEELHSYNFDKLQGVILTGEGEKSFVAGADIKSMNNMTVDEGEIFGRLGQDVTFLIESLKVPVIAAVNGFALGGGCEMAMSADFIYATNNALFGQPEVKLGLIPGFGGTQRLAKLIGRNRAKEIIYTGRNIKANEAQDLGLVVKLFESKDELVEASLKTIEEIAKNSPLAIARAKEVMNLGIDQSNEIGLKHELSNFKNIFASEDFKEGTTAFVEKRAANFVGR